MTTNPEYADYIESQWNREADLAEDEEETGMSQEEMEERRADMILSRQRDNANW